MVLQELARLSLHEPLLTEQMPALSESLAQNLFKNMLEKVLVWFDKFSKWQEQKMLALSFSMKLMPLEELDLMMDQEEIMKFKELCFR